MNNQTLRTKITFGLGTLVLGIALTSAPALAQDGVVHHRHHHLVRAPQDPAPLPQPQPCIHVQTSCL
jgi:hypothetical protein